MRQARVYRNRQQTFFVAILFTFLAYGALTATVEARRDGASAWIVGLGVVVVATLAWLAVAFARLGVVVSDTGIVVRNLFRTRRIGWDGIEGFSLDSARWFEYATVELKNAERIPIQGIAPPNRLTRPNNRSAEQLVDLLNGELHARGERRSSGG